MKDYIVEYSGPAGFDFGRLMNDDYFLAIRLLFENRRYVSAAKLVVSCIDTLSNLTFGDIPRSFQIWLDRYADLTSLQISSDELWEFRNSLLHMTNNESRRVAAGRVRALVFHVGKLPGHVPTDFGTFKSFDLMTLIQIVANAADRLLAELDQDRPRLMAFFERYDRILSDARYDEWTLPEP